MKSVLLTTLACALLAGCGKGAAFWEDQLAADPLYLRLNALSQSASCSALVPLEYGRTYPVPERASKPAYEVLFYPVATSAGRSTVASPRYEGDFLSDSPALDACVALNNPGALKDLGPTVPGSFSPAAYYKLQLELYQSLEKTAALYREGGAVGAADKPALDDFASVFPKLAEPGLLPYYYRLNPDFWEWLRVRCGHSIPKPD